MNKVNRHLLIHDRLKTTVVVTPIGKQLRQSVRVRESKMKLALRLHAVVTVWPRQL